MVFIVLIALCVVGFNYLPYQLAQLPAETWVLKNSDVIIVLGASAKKDGTPGSIMRERVLTGVKLFKEGIAPFIMFTGAAAHTKFVEAEVMADLAKSQGVPSERIVMESQARNTAQNAFDSYQLMKQRGWSSAVIVTSPEHLLRSNLFFSRYPIKYCMYPSNDPPESSVWDRLCFDQREKMFVLNDLHSEKGVSLGLKPEQAKLMPEIVKQAALIHAMSQ